MSTIEPTAGIILAAGMARRYGRTKQLLKLGGKFLLEWVLEAALASRLAGVVLVLGHEQEQIKQKLGSGTRRSRLRIVVNDRYREGLAYSLRAGLSVVQRQFSSAMFLLGDQPMVQTATIDYLLNCFGKSRKSICVPVYRGIRGNPTIFDRSTYGKLMAIVGDVGARNVIREHPQWVLTVEVDDPGCVRDIDVPADFEAFRNDLGLQATARPEIS